MATLNLSAEDFERTATKAAAEHPDIVFGEVDTEQVITAVRDLDVDAALAEQKQSAR